MNNINVEEIIVEIKKEIRERGLVDDAPSFNECRVLEDEEFDFRELKYWLEEMNTTKEIRWYREIHGNKIKVFVKKVIRKMIAFIIAPMVDEQNRYNEAMYNEIAQIAAYIKAKEDEAER